MKFELLHITEATQLTMVPQLLQTETVVVCAFRLADFSADRSALRVLLGSDEHTQSAAFRFDVDRERFELRRGLLRRLLSVCVQQDAANLLFGAGPFGKPFLVNFEDLHFSTSHSQGMAAIAVSRNLRIGVDIEAVQPLQNVGSLARVAISERDRLALTSLPPSQQEEAFFRLWSRLEALAKGVGTGLTERFDVNLFSLSAFVNTSVADTRWAISDITIADGFASAVAIERPIP